MTLASQPDRDDGAAVRVSFEMFPPRSPEAETALWATLARLEPLRPSFVSVTYGAGGSTRERTRNIVARMVTGTSLTPAAHLTCVGASRDDVSAVIQDYWDVGVRHIVALRGDPPGQLGGVYVPQADGYANATELVAAIAKAAPFEISVAAYPEKHPESPSIDHDIDVLKAKIDAGARRAITQFFFDVEAFYRFVDRARAAGISAPIVPGIVPVSNYRSLVKMAQTCQTRIPEALADRLEPLDDDPEAREAAAIDIASQMCAELVAQGFGDLHFYTLNRAEIVHAVCETLGLKDHPVGARP